MVKITKHIGIHVLSAIIKQGATIIRRDTGRRSLNVLGLCLWIKMRFYFYIEFFSAKKYIKIKIYSNIIITHIILLYRYV